MRAKLIAALETLRCEVCRRKPTPAEATEMYENFGHKTSVAEVPSLVWLCLSCGKKRAVA